MLFKWKQIILKIVAHFIIVTVVNKLIIFCFDKPIFVFDSFIPKFFNLNGLTVYPFIFLKNHANDSQTCEVSHFNQIKEFGIPAYHIKQIKNFLMETLFVGLDQFKLFWHNERINFEKGWRKMIQNFRKKYMCLTKTEIEDEIEKKWLSDIYKN